MNFTKKKLIVLVSVLLVMLLTAAITIGVVSSNTSSSNTDSGIVSGDDNVIDGDTSDGGNNDKPQTNPDDNENSGSEPSVPQQPPQKKQIYLDELGYDYQSVGHGNLSVNKDNDGNLLSLYEDGTEVVHQRGYYAHAYSTLVFENLRTMGFTTFSAYIGVNKTARVQNTSTSLVFYVYVDNKEVFVSQEFNAYSNQQYIEIDIQGADRITLVADSLAHNGHDHAVWADCQLTYYDDIKPDLQVYDMEFANPYTVTEANLLSNAKAYSWDGRNLSDTITYSTDYKSGKVGTFNITYKAQDGDAVAQKTVKLKVLSDKRYQTDATQQYLTQPFADFVYYGRSLLSEQSRLAYDYIMEQLLQVNISDSSRSSLTLNLQEEGIYILPNEITRIKKYLIYDEARLYFLYDWRSGESAGVSATYKNGLVETVTINLNNGANGYYNGHNNVNVYLQAEQEVTQFFGKLSYDMTDAQMLHAVISAYTPTLHYANVNYADGFYGAFITKQTICSGYSKGAQYLACRLGIRSAYIVGTAGGAHAWNNAYLDGQWYWYDTTWSIFNFRSATSDRYDHGNYSSMPTLATTDYNMNLAKYPLLSIKTNYTLAAGTQLDAKQLVNVSSSVANTTTIQSVTYTGTINTNKSGRYTLTVTAQNSLGNIVNGKCEVYVYTATDLLNALTPTMTGSSNWNNREVSLYYGGSENKFVDGIYTKANGTITLTYNISGKNYTYFSGYVGVDKVIRDNVSWGYYANATVKVYADGQLLFSKSNIGWKTDMTYFAVSLPDNVSTLQISVTDTSGQGGVGWGDCKLYR